MWTIFIRAVVLYVLLVLAMRALGKRQMGQFEPYEFVMTILIANLIATPMSEVARPLFHGLIPVAALITVSAVIRILCMRSDRVRAVISGKPSLIISKGVFQQEELKKLALNLSDVLEGIRGAGILDPAEVGTAVLEADGTISAFPRSSCRPPRNAEMGLDAGYEGMPMALVMDGRVQMQNLNAAHLSREWLDEQLRAKDLTERDVFLASIDTQGRLTVQDRAGNLSQYQAIPPSEVKW